MSTKFTKAHVEICLITYFPTKFGERELKMIPNEFVFSESGNCLAFEGVEMNIEDNVNIFLGKLKELSRFLNQTSRICLEDKR